MEGGGGNRKQKKPGLKVIKVQIRRGFLAKDEMYPRELVNRQ